MPTYDATGGAGKSYDPTATAAAPDEKGINLNDVTDFTSNAFNLYERYRRLKSPANPTPASPPANPNSGDNSGSSAQDAANKLFGFIPQEYKNALYRSAERDYANNVGAQYGGTVRKIAIGVLTLVAGVYVAKRLKVLK